jgi:uncharacterized membrane protein
MILVAGVSATSLYGQITGDIEVKALDRSGAPVTGAKVTARSQETGMERSAVTSGDGSVRLTLLNIGKYDVQVDAQGFASFKIPVDVNSGRVSDVKAAMEIAAAMQQVVVTDQAQPIDTTNAQLQTVYNCR